MKATAEIRDLAGMFGWDVHTDESRLQDTFIHGQNVVAVDYARNGAVREARRYEFASIAQLHLCERTNDNRKKGDVKSWLVQLGH